MQYVPKGGWFAIGYIGPGREDWVIPDWVIKEGLKLKVEYFEKESWWRRVTKFCN